MSEDMIVNEDRSKGQWFVVHTLSGHENKVKDNILRQLKNRDEMPIYEVFIPTEKVIEVRQGKRIPTTRKFFPGYVLVRMDLYSADGMIDQDAWYFVRSTQGVMGFLGGGNRPIPLSAIEAEEMLRQSCPDVTAKPKIEFEVGEVVRIKDGAFENFEGTIQEIDAERGKLKLMVSIFGRSTPVELEFWQVERSV